MRYYRVLPQFDNRPVYTKDGRMNSVYVGNELYTETEVKKKGLNRKYLEPVEVSKASIFWSFGSRFEIGKGRVR